MLGSIPAQLRANLLEIFSDHEAKEFLAHREQITLLRISTAGSVDDGKSTLIGRLLHDSHNIYEDHIEALEQASKKAGSSALALALVTDGLKAEQEQGITIDVAYRYFSTPKRRFILADSPGHEQYTRNMATAASTADLTLVLIDATKGVLPQTKRHAFIASLLGVPRLAVVINKMDLVNYSQEVFEKIKSDFVQFSGKLGIKEVRFVPVSSLLGDNVVERSENMPWYEGETVMQYLENVYVAADANTVDFRFPVQIVLRVGEVGRVYAGKISSGSVRVGEEVVVLPSMRKSTVRSIEARPRTLEASGSSAGESLERADAPQSVALTLSDQIDIGRGDMIVRTGNVPNVSCHFEAMLLWFDSEPMALGKSYVVMHTSRTAKAYIDGIRYRIDVNELSRQAAQPLHVNEFGRVALTSASPLFVDSYRKNRATGNFILIDPDNGHTVAAGMVLDRIPQENIPGDMAEAIIRGTPASQNIHKEESFVTALEREKRYGFRPRTIWFTGLSGSGKSSVAKALERILFEQGRPVYRLDGDNLRFGLNRDLGFSAKDRAENIRRAAEVAKLFNEAGVTVLCSFISPFESDRAKAREAVGGNRFIEVYLDTPLEVCEQRDPHGLYKKARKGEIKEFTGVSAPFEAPSNPELRLNTAFLSIEEAVQAILVRLLQEM